jgi:hypothetical protein
VQVRCGDAGFAVAQDYIEWGQERARDSCSGDVALCQSLPFVRGTQPQLWLSALCSARGRCRPAEAAKAGACGERVGCEWLHPEAI